MYSASQFPLRQGISRWGSSQNLDEQVNWRTKAFQDCAVHSKRGRWYQNDLPRQSSPEPRHPFRTHPRVTDFKAAMHDERYKRWNAPLQIDRTSNLGGVGFTKLELHVPSVEALNVEDHFLSPSLDNLRSFRKHPYPWSRNVLNTTMAERDRLFKRFNARPKMPTEKYKSHYLDANTQGSRPAGPFSAFLTSDESKDGGWKLDISASVKVLAFFLTLLWLISLNITF
jgi:hypothetical protein